jgi:cysteine desulfurase/selenocysteine lyase
VTSPAHLAQAAVEPERRIAFDVERVRADFPILGRTVYDRPLVYLDNAASAQKPRAMIDTMRQILEGEYANVHRGLHYLSQALTDKYEGAREKVARFINAGSWEEIVFTRNATEAINLVAASYGRTFLDHGDEVVISHMEHHANIVPWQLLRTDKGIRLRVVPIDDDGNFLLKEYEKLLGPRTKLVAVTHASNVLGTITPIKEIVRLAHDRGIPVLVDGSQAVVHARVDVRELDADFYAFTGHKLYGPTGIGVLYGKAELLEKMPPYQGGGEMISHVTFDKTTFKEPPQRFEAGTPPIVEAIGLGAAIDYVGALGMDAIAAHERDLLAYATERVSEIPGLSIQGRAENKCSILSFTMEDVHPHDIGTLVDRAGVAVRAGHHCAHPLMERFGVTATARASFAMYNTRQEVDALVDALHGVREFFA